MIFKIIFVFILFGRSPYFTLNRSLLSLVAVAAVDSGACGARAASGTTVIVTPDTSMTNQGEFYCFLVNIFSYILLINSKFKCQYQLLSYYNT